MTPQKLVEQMNWRYAVKKFDPTRKLSDADWNVLKELLILTPSSYGLQPWKFLIIQNPELRKKLRVVSWNQSQVEDCSHFIVFAGKDKIDEDYIKKYMSHIAQIRGITVESLKGFHDSIMKDAVNGPRAPISKEWSARQGYIALGNLMTVAAMMKIDTCPLEGLDAQEYDKILELKGSGYSTLCACAVGYRSPEDKTSSAKKVRFHHDEVIQYR